MRRLLKKFAWLFFWVLFFPQYSLAQDFVPGDASSLLHSQYPVCTNTKRGCTFSVAENSYLVKKGHLSRKSNDKVAYKNRLLEKGDKIRIVSLSNGANVLAVTIVNQSLSMRVFGGGFARPDDIDRSYRIGLYSPKSGSLIKTFDLGAFLPVAMELSADGELVLVAGRDIERREIEEVRIYNARSGRVVHSSRINDAKNVKLYTNGYVDGGKAWAMEAIAQGETVVYNSRDPFAIAEYEVTCSSFVRKKTLPDEHTIGILPISNDIHEQGEIFATALVTEFKKKGFNIIERSKLKTLLEEIRLSMTGLTSSQQIVDLGRLLSATHLVLSEVKQTGKNILLSIRLVMASSGEINSSCHLICRDCEQQDLFEGVSKVSNHWLKE